MVTKRHPITLDEKLVARLVDAGVVSLSKDGRVMGLSGFVSRCVLHCLTRHIKPDLFSSAVVMADGDHHD